MPDLNYTGVGAHIGALTSATAVVFFSQAMRQPMISTGYGTEKVLRDGIAKKILKIIVVQLKSVLKTL